MSTTRTATKPRYEVEYEAADMALDAARDELNKLKAEKKRLTTALTQLRSTVTAENPQTDAIDQAQKIVDAITESVETCKADVADKEAEFTKIADIATKRRNTELDRIRMANEKTVTLKSTEELAVTKAAHDKLTLETNALRAAQERGSSVPSNAEQARIDSETYKNNEEARLAHIAAEKAVYDMKLASHYSSKLSFLYTAPMSPVDEAAAKQAKQDALDKAEAKRLAAEQAKQDAADKAEAKRLAAVQAKQDAADAAAQAKREYERANRNRSALGRLGAGLYGCTATTLSYAVTPVTYPYGKVKQLVSGSASTAPSSSVSSESSTSSGPSRGMGRGNGQ